MLTIILCSCSDDDAADSILRNVKARVINTTSCSTENDIPAYTLAIDRFNFEIITGTLPVEFQQSGLEISVDMERSYENITFCTANFLPEQFYKVSNVSLASSD